jgi:hypothetical protein
MRHPVPGATRSQHVEDAVDDLTIRELPRSPCSALGFDRGKQRFQDSPVGIRQVGGVKDRATHATSLPTHHQLAGQYYDFLETL